MTRISAILFNKHEQPKRANIITSAGPVEVHWVEDYGDRNWFTTGKTEARRLAIPAVEKIERLFT